jgi:hypothetical protein
VFFMRILLKLICKLSKQNHREIIRLINRR